MATTTKKATVTSTNGRCGAEFGSCPEGQCCSQYGYCGVSSDHCTTGCQSSFGQCGSTTNKKTSVKKTTATTKMATTTKKATVTSTNGRCGTEFGSCPEGQCCSQYGYCGVSSDHCTTGCQSSFGQCGAISSSTGLKYYDSCINKKHWALTFDDGPYDYDMDLLDLLKKKGVKATFFINGANVMDIKTTKAKNIIQRMDKDGHIVASHTWSHADIAKISKSELIKEMTQLEDYIYKYIGKKPAFMRPPYGSGDGNVSIAKTLGDLGYSAAILWNVDTLDWDQRGVDYALSQFKKYQGKPILSLNHNYYGGITKNKLLELAEKEIDYMKKQGYISVTMDECLGLEAYK
ncbi:glycoside hydrolase/deacetylase [Piromyces finnis]|uniref:Glycoside hydrolase/deacetylase n=1 Tax=Piromyces finnis TaxID=1754191 RepID=A0A1Y1V2W0_9FUNG|nr:glycoside hydrolase/deacetylase [Piromyces finnis]|eukprot:ORX46003.1 glycoside hydrolase/deacetylase [Piromyces finnis]